jgi:hypothetical protein
VENSADPSLLPYIIFWFCFSFIETGVSRTFLHNYYLIFIPPLAIISAWFFVKLTREVRAFWPGLSGFYSKIALLLLTIASLTLGLLPNYPYLYQYYAEYLTGQIDYTVVLEGGLPDGVAETMQAIEEIGQYIKVHTNQHETIYYWSNFMELYYYADRQSSADIIWPLYVDAFDNKEQVFEAEYILLGDTPLGYQETPAWLIEGLNRQYKLEITVYEQQLYRRTP